MPMSKLDTIKDVAHHGFRKIKVNGKSVLIDSTTANAMLKVHDALSVSGQEQFLNMDWDKMVSVTWKLIKK